MGSFCYALGSHKINDQYLNFVKSSTKFNESEIKASQFLKKKTEIICKSNSIIIALTSGFHGRKSFLKQTERKLIFLQFHKSFNKISLILDNILQKPLITIITVVLNDQDNIEKTILSVLKQDYKNIQYIVIDGDSKDGTNKIIKKYSDKINIFKSEKDEGIYDAFNKGLDLATGDLIGFVNSGDTLTTESLTILNKYYHNYPKADFFFGAVRKHWGTLYGYKKWKIYFTWGFYSSHSTGFFIKKEAAKLVGKYNLKYKYSSDYDYFYRMIVKNKLFGIGTKK